jgi:uncharacterized membrane protein
MKLSAWLTLGVLALVGIGAARSDAAAPTDHLRFIPVSVCDTCWTLPYGINDEGQISGSFFDAAGTTRAFVKTGDKYDVVNIPGATFSELFRISDSGTAVGDYADADGIYHPFTRNPDGILNLLPGCPDATFSGAIDIFDHDKAILGYCTKDPAQTTVFVGYILQDGHYVTGAFPGANVINTFYVYMNNRGDLVGSFETGTVAHEHGFLRTPDGKWTQIDFPGSLQTEVFQIDDNGEMLGRYMDQDGIDHGFFLKNNRFQSFDFVGGKYPSTYIWTQNHKGFTVGYGFDGNPYGPPTQGFVVRLKGDG